MTKTEQILKNGNIVLDYDQTLSSKEIKDLLSNLFGTSIIEDGKQFILFDKIAVLACNVTYLGNPHPLYKKRIQLKSYYLDYLNRNNARNIETIYLGIYTYQKTTLFVVFEPATYATKKSHNSSAHIYSINLQYAQRTGSFSKIDAFGNVIHVFNTYEFIRYAKELVGIIKHTNTDEILNLIYSYIASFKKEIKKEWNGIECYKEMLDANDNNAKQGEWPGWYFEYLFKKFLVANKNDDVQWCSNKKENGVDLDIKFNNGNWVYGDLKADQIRHDILGNSLECLDNVIKINDGIVYYICCLYKAQKDSEHNYEVSKFWNSIRDEKKRYKDIEELKKRYGKKMKYSVEPQLLCVLKIDAEMYEILRKTPFNQGINSDGKDRKPKLKVTKDMIKALSIYQEQIN